jgi:histidyl-tRNA synthetase
MIESKIVKGFRDALPIDEWRRQLLMEQLIMGFRQEGYMPIDTPAIEYAEMLLGKSAGETEKQIFRFSDAGGRDVALRFDLTVPFARYMAMHKEEVGLPFKRYHLAKVWRGEKPQKGRYREFFQCDFDCIGSNSLASDMDILLTAVQAFQGLGIDKVTFHINHRAVLNQFLYSIECREQALDILHLVDKLGKIGAEALTEQLEALVPSKATVILSFIHMEADFEQTLAKMKRLLGGEESPEFTYLTTLYKNLVALNLIHLFVLNPAITRGLDYYTGLVFETYLTEQPSIGSVCSGGRYDNLLGLYSKESISGVGGSIGLDRLLAAYEDNPEWLLSLGQRGFIYYNSDYVAVRQVLNALKPLGLPIEAYPDDKKVDAQSKYAIRHGATFGIFIEGAGYTLRLFASKQSVKDLSLEQLVSKIKETLFG